ncbi:MAG: hypothetical protein JXR77_13455 [Lentisphaeria bacterium]|nr:hypothetical protein [Lentisphaeria bacterium]
MTEPWLEFRRRLFFGTEAGGFEAACGDVRRELSLAHRRAGGPLRAGIETAMAEFCLDLQSYLPRWRLQAPARPGVLPAGVLEAEAVRCRGLLREWQATAALERVAEEETLLARSNFLRLTRIADTGRLATRWGYDYADGVAAAMRRGALLVTTNPPLVNLERKERPRLWEPVREELRGRHGTGDPDRLAALFTARVVLRNCRMLRPVYEASEGRCGYVNLQVNPHAADDADAMAREIEWLHAALSEELQGTPNVVFKVPGTRAALETVAMVTAKGIGVTITLAFSVDQHIAFGEVIEQGRAPVSFLVMMSGRLDDPVRDELAAAGVDGAAECARWASTAVIRRSYEHVYGDMGCRKSALLVASLRGPWNVDAAIAEGPAPVFVTSFPDKTEEYDSEPREIVCRMAEPIPGGVLARLRRSPLFCQAVEAGEIGVAGFDAYLPVAMTQTAFAAAWDELRAWLVS